MKVRHAVLDDVEHILHVINTTNEEAFKELIPAEHFISPILDETSVVEELESKAFIVCEHNREIVGVAAWKDIGQDVGELHWVYVLPEYQRMGIGRRLVATAEKEARARGLTTIRLKTPAEALWAFRFYQRLGYSISDNTENPWGFDIVLEKSIR